MATDKQKHLEKALETHSIDKLTYINEFVAKKNHIKKCLDEKFKEERASKSIDSGSYAKNTAVNTKFDIDSCIPFKKKTVADEKGYEKLKDMYEAVFDYFKNEYEDDELVENGVRKQRVSIGLEFIIDGHTFNMDVVPGRERPSNGDYNDSNTDLSLYIHNRSNCERELKKTSIKTNIRKHVDLLANRPHERKIAKLLKVWKIERKKREGGRLIKSFMMELYVKEAFDKNEDALPIGLWGKTKMVMNYIIDNIEDRPLCDPANSNNNVANSMSDNAKKTTKSDMKKTINEVEADADNIKVYFPINEEFDNNDDEADATSASVLNTSKFG